MAHLTAPVETSAPPQQRGPRRRTLVGLAVAFLLLYSAMMATGTDFEHDAKLADVNDHFGDISQSTSQIGSYVGMVLVGIVLFLGACFRNTVRRAGGAWLGDVVLLGFAALAATFASWGIIDAAMWRAVDYGDDSATRALLVLGDVSFLPLMASMIAIYVGTGLAGWTTGSLPKWLAGASIVVGVIAPIGPLGFVGALLLPLWSVTVAALMRVEPSV